MTDVSPSTAEPLVTLGNQLKRVRERSGKSLRGRAFAVLMSSNVAMLTIGMIAAGKLTDVVGARWIWAAAAVGAAAAAVAGFALARRVITSAPAPALTEPPPVATRAEPTQRAV